MKSAVTLLLLFSSLFYAIARPADPLDRPKTHLQIEVGIDSLERRYYRPRFTFAFPILSWVLATEVSYHQRIDGSLQGAIDYWIDLAFARRLSERFRFETRLNHMCRHLTSVSQSNVFNLNEVLGKIWFSDHGIRAAAGAGFYVGGTATYRNLLQFNLEIPRLFAGQVGFSGQFTWTDFRRLFHELEIFFPLNPSTEIFLRHTRHYQYADTTYIGLRIQSENGTEKYLHEYKILGGVFPAYNIYKVTALGDITLDFFHSDSRRVITTIAFVGPILAGEAFFGSFSPDRMIYDIWLQYEKKIGKKIFLAWYGKYTVDMPCDKAIRFDADLGTGMALRNQPDFERLGTPFRFELMGGVNFKHDFDFVAKVGFNTMPKEAHAAFGFNGYLRGNAERTFVEARAFAEFGRNAYIRPFIGIDRVNLSPAEKFSWSHFMFGVELSKWFK